MLKRDITFLLGLLIGLPLCFSFLGFTGLFAWALSTPPHELGHTLAAWLTSHWASPTMFFTVMPSEDRQMWLFAAEVIACALIFRAGLRGGGAVCFLVSITWLVLLLIGTFVLKPNAQDQLILWSGQGGEQILATVMIMAALIYGDTIPWVEDHYTVLLFWGAMSYTNSVRRWYLSQNDPTQVPFGAFGESGDAGDASNGDVDRLLEQYHWTLDQLTHSYLRTAAVCFICIGIASIIAMHVRKDEVEEG